MAVAVVAIGILVGSVDWQTTGLVLAIAVCVWLGMNKRDWGLGVLALTLPVQTYSQVGIQSGSVTLTKVAIWSLLAGWTVSLLRSRQRVLIDFVTVSVFVLIAALVLSVWNARDGGIWIGETYRWLATGIISCFAFNTYRRGGSPLPFLVGSLLGVLGSVVLALWQVIYAVGPESYQVRGFLRAYGPFTHPNQLAIYLELTVPLFLALLLGPGGDAIRDGRWYLSPRLRPLWMVGVFAGLLGSVLSQSRGGLAGMAAGFAIVGAMLIPHLRISIVRLAPLGLIVALALLTISIGIVSAGVKTFANEETLVTPANFAVQERLSHWTAAVEMAKAHPFVGVGAGNYDLNYRDFTQEWRFRIGRGHAHNTYLHFLAQSGVVGLTAYIAMLMGVSLIIVRSIRIMPGGSRLALLIGAAGVTAATGAHAVFEYVHVLSLNIQLVVIWAMAIAIGTEAWSARGNS
ncbi:MAG: O-antigen ligase family protein [Thermomicrobiales bacterium]